MQRIHLLAADSSGRRDFGRLTPYYVPATLEGLLTHWLATPEVLPGHPSPEEVKTFEALPPDERKSFKNTLLAWSPADYDGERRLLEHCKERQVIGHDFDSFAGDNWESVVQRIAKLLPNRYLAIHTSPTERNPDGTWRVRVYEILDRPLRKSEWARAQEHMRSLGEGDRAALDMTRIYYLPVKTSGYQYTIIRGPRTPVDSLPQVTPAATTAPVSTTSVVSFSPAQHLPPRLLAAAQLLASGWPTPGNGRHIAQLALAGALKSAGWAREDALEFLCVVCRIAGDEDRAKRVQTIERTWSTEQVTGWTTLSGRVPSDILTAARLILDRAPTDMQRAKELLSPSASTPVLQGRGWKIRWGGWDQPPPVAEYLIADWIIAGKISMLYAAPGSIKSWTCLSMALAIAQGTPWLEVHATQQAPVLYIDHEDGEDEFHRRVHLLTEGQEVSALGYTSKPEERPNTLEFWMSLTAIVKEKGIRFVVIDTLAAALPGVDENDTQIATPLHLASSFCDSTKCHVMFVHHANKQGQLRGSSSLLAAVDTSIKLELEAHDGEHPRSRMQVEKSGQKKPEQIVIELTGQHKVQRVETYQATPVDKTKVSASDEEIRAEILLQLAAAESRNSAVSSQDNLFGLVRAGLTGGAKTDRMAVQLKELIARGDVTKLDKYYIADNDDRRWNRVREQLYKASINSPSKLANAANVKKTYVDRLMREGMIAPKMSGKDPCGYVECMRRTQ